jgi:aspartyl-tRNA synthetase
LLKRTHYSNEVQPGNAVLSGWVHTLRDLGNIKFIVLRDTAGIAQITVKKGVVKDEMLKIVDGLAQEDVLSVSGTVVTRRNAPNGMELIPERMEVVSKVEAPLPMSVDGKIESNLDTRLNWRVLDLRRPENAAIFKVQATITRGMETFLQSRGFLKVFTPCLIGTVSESGAEVFPVLYYDREAFLRQDPQLHRQLLIAAGFDRLYDVGPNWRAEPSHTPRHVSEHRACAVEFAFMGDESEMMRLEEAFVVAVTEVVKEGCEEELGVLGTDLAVPRTPFPELRFPQVYEILAEYGKEIPFGEDYDRASERLLWRYVKEKYNSDFFFVNRFPFKVKPFYVMRAEENAPWARSVDLLCKGLELSSGGQREHRHGRLVEQIQEKGMSPENLEWFTKFFRYGVPPHGGFCIGIERLTMQLLDLKNIREAALFPRAPERLLP